MCPYKAVDSHGSFDTIVRAKMKINISVCVYLGVLFEVYVPYNECNTCNFILRDVERRVLYVIAHCRE